MLTTQAVCILGGIRVLARKSGVAELKLVWEKWTYIASTSTSAGELKISLHISLTC